MTIIRRGSAASDKTTTIRRALAQDEQLSFRALGVVTYVLSKPPNWSTDAVRLSKGEGREGEKAVRSALREAEARGYLLRWRRQVPAGGEKVGTRTLRGGSWVTEWEITDDPATLDRSRATGRQKRPAGQPPAGQGTAGEGTAGGRAAPGSPAVVGRETGERNTTPPPPAVGAEEFAAAVVVVVREAGMKQPPGLGVLTAACAKLRAYGWDVPTLERAAREHDWSGARAGAVVAWVRGLTLPPAAATPAASRPTWCGRCHEATRMLEASGGRVQRCPDCHPLAGRDGS